MNIGNSRFAERVNLCIAIKPIDFSGGANAGDWVSLKGYERCAIILVGKVGTSGTDLTVTLNQAQNVAGLNSKALTAITHVDTKEGADLLAIGQYTGVDQAAASTYTFANNEQLDQIYVLDIQGTDLDKDNNYDCLQISVNQGSAAKLITALYALYDPKFGSDPLPSAIID